MRLSTTRAGRRILEEAGINAEAECNARKVALSASVRGTFKVEPLPRNVHPQFNEGRRKARARALLKSTANCPGLAAFVDAAQYGRSDRYAAVSIRWDGTIINAASVKGVTSEMAEQVAIAMAMRDPERPYVYTDSRSAARAFASGSISREAAAVLGNEGAAGHHIVKWFPAHMGADVHPDFPNANELAHDRARGLTHRGDRGERSGGEGGEHRDPLLTFNEITTHYQLSRRAFPLPHAKLNRPQSSIFRMLQTGSFPSRGRLSLYSPEVEPQCPDCGES